MDIVDRYRARRHLQDVCDFNVMITVKDTFIYLLRPREGWSMARDATLSRRVVMTTRS